MEGSVLKLQEEDRNANVKADSTISCSSIVSLQIVTAQPFVNFCAPVKISNCPSTVTTRNRTIDGHVLAQGTIAESEYTNHAWRVIGRDTFGYNMVLLVSSTEDIDIAECVDFTDLRHQILTLQFDPYLLRIE